MAAFEAYPVHQSAPHRAPEHVSVRPMLKPLPRLNRPQRWRILNPVRVNRKVCGFKKWKLLTA